MLMAGRMETGGKACKTSGIPTGRKMSNDTHKVNTGDGSSTLYSARFNEHYHSTHGALQESRHVFIKSGLEHASEIFDQVNILEYGFGTGLNALLALQFSAEKRFPVNYHGFEAFPIESIDQLPDYPSQIGAPDLQAATPHHHIAQHPSSPTGLNIVVASLPACLSTRISCF